MVEPLPLNSFAERLAVMEARMESDLKNGGGNGTSGGVTDDWKSSVEARLGQLHKDVRGLLYAGIAVAIGLAGLVGGLYLHSDGKFDTLNDRITNVQLEQQRSSSKLDAISAKLDRK